MTRRRRLARARALSTALRALGAAAALAGAASTVSASTLYVADEFSVGLHTGPSVEAPVAVLVPSGAALELLEGDETMARVRTEGGQEGWIDRSYVTATAPVATRMLTLRTTNEALRAEVGTLRGEVARLDHALREATVDQERRLEALTRKAELELALRDARIAALTARRIEAEPDAGTGGGAPRTVPDAAPPAAVIPVQQLPATAAPGAGMSAVDSPLERLRALALHEVMALGFAALGLFGLGALWQDYLVRRRHGGFRL